MIKCSKCQTVKEDEQFNWKNQADNKKDKWCKDCRKEYDKETRRSRYLKNQYREIANNHNRIHGGHLTDKQLLASLEFFGYCDAYTGLPFMTEGSKVEMMRNVITFDHVIPLKEGGSNEIWNIVPTTRQNSGRKHALKSSFWAMIPECRKVIIEAWKTFSQKIYKSDL